MQQGEYRIQTYNHNYYSVDTKVGLKEEETRIKIKHEDNKTSMQAGTSGIP